MRLTCKPDGVMENYYYETTEKTISKDRIAILNKLGKLEDIEQELGIDLIILFKALEKINEPFQNVYIKYKGKHFIIKGLDK